MEEIKHTYVHSRVGSYCVLVDKYTAAKIRTYFETSKSFLGNLDSKKNRHHCW